MRTPVLKFGVVGALMAAVLLPCHWLSPLAVLALSGPLLVASLLIAGRLPGVQVASLTPVEYGVVLVGYPGAHFALAPMVMGIYFPY